MAAFKPAQRCVDAPPRTSASTARLRRRQAGSRFLQPSNPAEALIRPNEWIRIVEVLKLPSSLQVVAARWFHGVKEQQIADELGVGLATLRTYVRRVYEKLQVGNKMHFALRIIHVRDLLRSTDRVSASR